jgi:hypothetical protein
MTITYPSYPIFGKALQPVLLINSYLFKALLGVWGRRLLFLTFLNETNLHGLQIVFLGFN